MRNELKRAFVTGAGSGLGRAIATALSAAGLEVTGLSRNPWAVNHPGCAHWVAGDLSQPEEAARILDEHPRLLECDVLVNNAGSGYFTRLEDADPEALRHQIELMLLQPMELTRRFYAAMRLRGHGSIVNVSSLAAHLPLPMMPAYDAAKGGLTQFTRALMLEARGSGIQIVDLRPGDYRTAFNAATLRHGGRSREGGDPVAGAVWERMEAHLAAAPEAEHAARCLLRVLDRGSSGSVACGGFFQTRMAMLAYRLLPWSGMARLIRGYYRLP